MIDNQITKEDLGRIHGLIGARQGWNGATVVVTGCAGFVGFYLLQYLVSYASELQIRKVIGLDSYLLGKPQWLSRLAENCGNHLCLQSFDVTRDEIGAVGDADKARYVIHAASVASPRFYRKYPIETIDANIGGLRRLLEFYKDSDRLEGFLFFSSSEIYGDPEARSIPTDEEYRGNVACVGPRACYDESKRLGETISYVFAKSYDLPITIVRPFNNYGPGMRLDDARLPADLAKCVIEQRDIVLFSNGLPTRTYCYISDAVTGYLLCLLHGRYDYFNIGADNPEISVRDFAELYRATAADLLDYRGKVHLAKSDDHEYLTDNPLRRCPDISKAREKLGFSPEVSLEEGVRRHLTFLKSESRIVA